MLKREKKEVVEQFPVAFRTDRIEKEYFYMLRHLFAAQVLERLPTAKSVIFLLTEAEAVAAFSDPALQGLLDVWRGVVENRTFYGIKRGRLLFRIPVVADSAVVACVGGADKVFLARLDEDWLQDVCRQLCYDFSLLCTAYIDLETDLPNLSYLQVILDHWQKGEGYYLALVELPSKNSLFLKGYRFLQSSRRMLRDFLSDPEGLYYLGQRTFAIILPDPAGKNASFRFENSLIAYLKKGGCYKVHIGSSQRMRATDCDGITLLNQAWTALQYAEKRGPFSFCSYQHWAYPEQHKFAPVSRSLQIRMGKVWREMTTFSLLLFRSDGERAFSRVIAEKLRQQQYCFQEGEDYFLLLPGDKGPEAKKQAETMISFAESKGIEPFSVGISTFPYADFKKSEMIVNCKKALIHASFYGMGSYAVFDQLSLNISGDIYFSEGDFTRAIREYRRGLASGSDEVNLLNSLGVTLALMNRLKLALKNFSRALQLEPDNYMALYNSGLALKDMGEESKAFSFLEQAYNIAGKKSEGQTVLRDLELSLGFLGVKAERPEATIVYLGNWLKQDEGSIERGKVYWYLGLAYYKTGEFSRAVDFLQRALHYDQFDAKSMGLLGYLYLKTGEGDDVAYSLCRKSVDLEPENLQSLLYFAEVMMVCKDYDGARKYLQRCQRVKALRNDALILLSELHLQQGRIGLAKRYAEKLLTQPHITKDLRQRIKIVQKNIKIDYSGNRT